jgi:ABC-type transport system involved in multi-copper enzyme maturation permease subunit
MRTIIIKEFLDYLKSIQFFFLLFFSIVLFITGGLFLGKRYNDTVETLNSQHASTVETEINERPSLFNFLAAGYQDSGLRVYTLYPGGNYSIRLNPYKNFMLPDLPPPDWSFIVKCVFSLYVMLLGFSVISGEKELGTLRLIMSNSLGRLSLASAKYLSMMLVISVSLLAGLIAGTIVTGILVPEIFSLDFLVRAAVFFCVSLAWLSLFAFLALTVSALISNSSLSLLTLLSVWILFILVVPNVSGPLSEKFTAAPGEYEIAQNLGPAFQEKMERMLNPVFAKLKQEGATEERFKEEYAKVCAGLINDYAKILRDYQQSNRHRESIQRSLSRISPASLYQFSMEELASTGFRTQEVLLRNLREYGTQYDSYILEKTGELIPGAGLNVSSSTDLQDGTVIYLESHVQKEYDGDKSDFPFFSTASTLLKTSWTNALPDLAGLLAWNIVLALAAFRAVLRCDVR